MKKINLRKYYPYYSHDVWVLCRTKWRRIWTMHCVKCGRKMPKYGITRHIILSNATLVLKKAALYPSFSPEELLIH